MQGGAEVRQKSLDLYPKWNNFLPQPMGFHLFMGMGCLDVLEERSRMASPFLTGLGRSYSLQIPNAPNAFIIIKHWVPAENRQVFRLTLCDDQAVKRILVMKSQ
jgi:hypothetical protein